MARAWRTAALSAAALFLCGCGTVANLSTGSRLGWRYAQIYGGVRRDVQSADSWIRNNWTSGENLDILQDVGTVVGVALVGIDVPLSAALDTLTLPITVPVALVNTYGGGARDNRNSNATPPQTSEPVNPNR
jgi:uncharacterized protein YceK